MAFERTTVNLLALFLTSCASAPIAPDALTTGDYCTAIALKICQTENPDGMSLAHCAYTKLVKEKRCGE